MLGYSDLGVLSCTCWTVAAKSSFLGYQGLATLDSVGSWAELTSLEIWVSLKNNEHPRASKRTVERNFAVTTAGKPNIRICSKGYAK